MKVMSVKSTSSVTVDVIYIYIHTANTKRISILLVYPLTLLQRLWTTLISTGYFCEKSTWLMIEPLLCFIQTESAERFGLIGGGLEVHVTQMYFRWMKPRSASYFLSVLLNWTHIQAFMATCLFFIQSTPRWPLNKHGKNKSHADLTVCKNLYVTKGHPVNTKHNH